MWTKIKKLLLYTANKIVSKSFISLDNIISKPKQLVDSYVTIKVLNNILLQFYTKYIDKSIWLTDSIWVSQITQIQWIIITYKLKQPILLTTLNSININLLKRNC